MCRFAIIVILFLVSTAGFTQLQPRPSAIRPVSDPSMVIDDRGSNLEVFPMIRASQHALPSGNQNVHSIFSASTSAPISPQQLGVVFSHAMQVQGYITGEIAFKMKGSLRPTRGFETAYYPGLRKLTDPNIYLVVARTPTEFVELAKRLQGRTDVEWVEPIVTYGAQEPASGTR